MPYPKKIGWAIVGLGAQAEKIAAAINASVNGRLEAVIDDNLARAKDFAVRYRAASYYDSYPKALGSKAIDAMFIASPNYRHAYHSLHAVENRIPTLCEKPLTISLKEGLAIERSVKRNRVPFGVGFHLRHHPLAREAQRLIKAGSIGVLILVELRWSTGALGQLRLPALHRHRAWRDDVKKSGGGAIMSRGVHLFDLLRFITGRDIQEVTALTDTDTKKKVDALALGILKLNGMFATLATSLRLPCAKNEIAVYGSRGRLLLRDILATHSVGSLEWFNGTRTVTKTAKRNDLYQQEIEDFGRRLQGKQWIGADLEDGLKTVAVTEAFYRSAAAHKAVPVKIC